ncbi:MAG: LysR family transcriptional regulator [Caulobacteraceae bacterium]|nr:LysR family transcriptional regulator [Caulobacteraceae bacterium]
MASDPDWSHYRAFLAVLDGGSLTAAGRALGLTQPTLGRQIQTLETALGGAPLFTKSVSGLRPTAAALALEPHARTMAAAAAALVRTAAGRADDDAGVIRVTSSEMIGAEILPGLLRTFRDDHPRVDFELSLSNTVEDLLRREADIAVRTARPTQQALVARRATRVRLKLYATRGYLARHGAPRTIEDTAGHALIGFDRQAPRFGAADIAADLLRPEIFALRTDNDLGALAALRAGFGIGACQETIAARSPDLVEVLPGALDLDLDVWVAMHEDLKADPRLRALFDHLVTGLAAFASGRASGGAATG